MKKEELAILIKNKWIPIGNNNTHFTHISNDNYRTYSLSILEDGQIKYYSSTPDSIDPDTGKYDIIKKEIYFKNIKEFIDENSYM
jgi:hypothetical protein